MDNEFHIEDGEDEESFEADVPVRQIIKEAEYRNAPDLRESGRERRYSPQRSTFTGKGFTAQNDVSVIQSEIIILQDENDRLREEAASFKDVLLGKNEQM